MRLVGYIRVSRVAGREGDSFISPTSQRDRVDALARAGGHRIVEWVEDLDESGGSMRRPGVERALQMVERGEAQGVAVAKLDRFSRSVVDTELGIRRIEAAGGVFLAADLGLDTSTPTGKLMRNVVAAFAEFQRDRIRETWRDATERAIARGARGGPVPTGYDRGDDGRFIPNADADGVRALFEMRAAGDSWADIARHLEETTGHGWGHSTMRRIVRNRVYLGELRAGDMVRTRAHEPLVSRAEWEAAQSPPGVNRGRAGTLLGGLIRCATCGHCMYHEAGGARRYRGYRCFRLHPEGTCPTGAKIGAERAEAWVVEQFLADAAGWRFEAVPTDDAIAVAVTHLEAVETELAAYRDANLLSVVGADEWRAGYEHRARAVDEARGLLAQARRDADVQVIGSRDLGTMWDQFTLAEKRRILRATIDRVECLKAHRLGPGTPVEDRLRIVWVGDTP